MQPKSIFNGVQFVYIVILRLTKAKEPSLSYYLRLIGKKGGIGDFLVSISAKWNTNNFFSGQRFPFLRFIPPVVCYLKRRWAPTIYSHYLDRCYNREMLIIIFTTRRHEFRSWTRLITFHIALIPLGKVWIQLFSLQLWVNSRTD